LAAGPDRCLPDYQKRCQINSLLDERVVNAPGVIFGQFDSSPNR
jgi:hypothetical protein